MTEDKSVFKKIGLFILGLLIILGWFLVSEIPTLILGFLMPAFEKPQLFINILLMIFWLVVLVGIIYLIWRYYMKKSGDKNIKLSGKDIWRAFVIFLVGRVIVIVGTIAMTMIYGDGQSQNDLVIEEMFGPDKPVFYVLLLAVVIAIKAPILEELLFRGLPTALLFKKSPMWVPMLLTSLVFSSAHLSTNIISFAMYASLGALMYWAYASRGRIIDSMMVHFFNNIFGAIALLVTYFSSM